MLVVQDSILKWTWAVFEFLMVRELKVFIFVNNTQFYNFFGVYCKPNYSNIDALVFLFLYSKI